MVIMWTLGDMFKTGYFIVRESPTQFWICGMLQVCKEIVLLHSLCLCTIRVVVIFALKFVSVLLHFLVFIPI